MKPKRGAGLFARTPKGDPVYFSMICSASSSRRLICHVVSARHPARDVQREIPHKPHTLLSPVFGICSRFGSIQPIRPPGALPCTSSYFSMKRWSMAAISARVAVPCGSSRLPDLHPFDNISLSSLSLQCILSLACLPFDIS